MSAQTTSGLSQEMSTYYEKVFLARAEYEYIFNQGAQMRTQPANEGKTVVFTRHTPLATATTALTEGVNPAEVNLTATNVSATLFEYGNTVKISRFLSLTSIDANNKEKIEVVGQNMGETLDELTRNELFTGATTQLAGGKSVLTDVAITDVLSVAELRKAVRTLKVNKARRYQDRIAPWLGKVGPYTSYDLTTDSTFLSADIYDNGADKLYNGELGKILGVRLLESPNQYQSVNAGTSNAEVFSNFIHGSDAFGCIDLVGDKPQLYIIPHTKTDSGNPAGRFSMVSWATSYVTKTLNSTWLVNIKTGATGQV
jgi:N4-gp56 family major capsid protein